MFLSILNPYEELPDAQKKKRNDQTIKLRVPAPKGNHLCCFACEYVLSRQSTIAYRVSPWTVFGYRQECWFIARFVCVFFFCFSQITCKRKCVKVPLIVYMLVLWPVEVYASESIKQHIHHNNLLRERRIRVPDWYLYLTLLPTHFKTKYIYNSSTSTHSYGCTIIHFCSQNLYTVT